MKKIDRSKVECPKKITNDGPKEHLDNINFVLAGQFGSVKKSVYKSTANKNEIKSRIRELTNDKCAYCEMSLREDQQLNVEHYRPIKEVVYSKYDGFKPGYYWLSADWNNLLPSCPPCNSITKREFFSWQSGEWEGGNVGKGDRFPLYIIPHCRPCHTKDLNSELPLIFNPCDISVRQIIKYEESSNVEKGHIIYAVPASGCSQIQFLIASFSIQILGLNRMHLCTKRGGVVYSVRCIIEEIQKVISFTQVNNKIAADQIFRLLGKVDIRRKEVGFSNLIIQFFFNDIKALALELRRIENRSDDLVCFEDFLVFLTKYAKKYGVQNKPKSQGRLTSGRFYGFFNP